MKHPKNKERQSMKSRLYSRGSLYTFILMVSMIFLLACPSHPQSVSIKTTYTTTPVDSTYLVYWEGNNTSGCPLVEDVDWSSINVSDPAISVYKIPTGTNQQFTITKPTNGKTFKLAIVNWDNNLQNIPTPSKLTVSAFYVLPYEVQKATIINVEIN